MRTDTEPTARVYCGCGAQSEPFPPGCAWRVEHAAEQAARARCERCGAGR